VSLGKSAPVLVGIVDLTQVNVLRAVVLRNRCELEDLCFSLRPRYHRVAISDSGFGSLGRNVKLDRRHIEKWAQIFDAQRSQRLRRSISHHNDDALLPQFNEFLHFVSGISNPATQADGDEQNQCQQSSQGIANSLSHRSALYRLTERLSPEWAGGMMRGMGRFSLRRLFLSITCFAVGAAFANGAFQSSMFGPIASVLTIVAVAMFGIALFILCE
jgi:hypothetical protein